MTFHYIIDANVSYLTLAERGYPKVFVDHVTTCLADVSTDSISCCPGVTEKVIVGDRIGALYGSVDFTVRKHHGSIVATVGRTTGKVVTAFRSSDVCFESQVVW